MGLFEHFPYTNFHELNAHWILAKVKELLQRMAQAEEDIDVLEGRCDSLEERMTTAEGDIDALEGRCDSLEERMTTAEGDIDALEDRCTALESRCTALEARVETKYYVTGNTDAEVFLDMLDKYTSGIIYPVYHTPINNPNIRAPKFFIIDRVNYVPANPTTCAAYIVASPVGNNTNLGYLASVDVDPNDPDGLIVDWTALAE